MQQWLGFFSCMSCAWRLGAGVSRVVAQLLFFRAAASGAPSSHRVPGAPGHFPRTPGRASGSSYALQRTSIYAPSLHVHGLAQGKLIRSVDWGTILAWVRAGETGTPRHRLSGLGKSVCEGAMFGLPGPGKRVCEGATQVLRTARPWQKCLRRSHAGTFGGFSAAIVRVKEPRSYFRRVPRGDFAISAL